MSEIEIIIKVDKHTRPKGSCVGELVRCQDCKYYEQNDYGSGVCANTNFLAVKSDDYCSYAEKI